MGREVPEVYELSGGWVDRLDMTIMPLALDGQGVDEIADAMDAIAECIGHAVRVSSAYAGMARISVPDPVDGAPSRAK